jgi:hypothetical protein
VALFLYGYAPTEGSTIDEYADVDVIELPSIPQFVLIGDPASPPDSPDTLTVIHNQFDPGWQGPSGTRHVAVDGLLNGWVGRQELRNFRADYRPAGVIHGAFLVSGVGVVALFALGLFIGTKRNGQAKSESP